MRSRCILALFVLSVFCFAPQSSGLMPPGSSSGSGQSRPTTQSKPIVSSVAPRVVKLQQGGAAQTVVVQGRNLNQAVFVQVLYQGNATPNVTAKFLQPRTSTELNVELKASAHAVIGSGYQVRLVAGNQHIDVPAQAFELEVIKSEGLAVAPAEKQSGAPEKPGRQTSYAAGSRRPSPLRWSPVSMENPDPSRPHCPALSTIASKAVPSGKMAQVKGEPFKFATRAKIAFTPFEMKDPSTGKAVTPDTQLPAPYGKGPISARDYYAELNWEEASFNTMGFSLDIGQDPAMKVDLSPAPARPTHGVQKIKWRDYKDTRLATQQGVKNKLSNVRNFAPSQSEQQASGKFTVPVHAYGVQPPYHQTAAGTAFRESNWLIGAEETCSADLSADVDKMDIHNTWAVRGSILDNWFDIIRVESDTSSPLSNGQASATSTAYFLGQAMPWQGANSVTLPVTMPVPPGPLRQMNGGVPSQQFEAACTGSDTIPPYSWTFTIGYIPVTISVGAGANSGAVFSGTISPTLTFNNLQPYAMTDVWASAAVDLWLVVPKVTADLTLVSAAPEIEGTLTREFSGDWTGGSALKPVQAGSLPGCATQYLVYEYYIFRQLTALSGDITLSLDFNYPCWKDWRPGLCTKEYSYVICSWPGLVHSEYLVPQATGTYDLGYYPPGKIPGYDY